MVQAYGLLVHLLALGFSLQACTAVGHKSNIGSSDARLISQGSAEIFLKDPTEVNFVPYRFPKAKVGGSARYPGEEPTQQWSLFGLLGTFFDNLQFLPSSREAPDYLTQYQTESVEIVMEARFINADDVNRTAYKRDAVLVGNDTEKGLKLEPHGPALPGTSVRSKNTTIQDVMQRGGRDAVDALNTLLKTTALEDLFESNSVPQTTHSCQGAIHEHRVCKFHNLYLWNGTLYYVSNVQQPVPPVPLTWVSMPPFSKETLQVEMVTPNEVPFDSDVTGFMHIQDALLWLVTYYDNYGHLLGEHGPTIHNVICTYLSRCTYTPEDLNDFQILLTNPEPGVVETFPSAIMEMFSCMSNSIPRQSNDDLYKNKVVLINTALAGIGPTCRGFPWCRSRYKRTSPVPHVMNAWKARIMDCMGLPKNVIASAAAPSLLIINRPLSTGRGFLNIRQLMDHVQASHPEFIVQVRYLEKMTLRQQAELYHNATVLVQMHGAALGNIIFLPRGACIVDVVPMNNEDKHPWVIYMTQDFKPLYYYPISIPPQKSYLMLNKITKTSEFNMLTEEQKKNVVERGVCPTQAARPEYDVYAVCTYSWFLKQSNVELNFENLDSALSQAMSVLQSNSYRIKMIGVPGWRGLLSYTAPEDTQVPELSALPQLADARYNEDAAKPLPPAPYGFY